ncbi:SPOR domain-containing protein [Shimia sp.]|uniref:SPOR domain-containing protein n=1 Tax=Shimia sp. TaxID=1954381 RepID=UPI003BAB493D
MTLGKFLAIAAIATASGFGAAHAQSISDRQTPAEFPPANFQGKQFVDSRGCVYIRSGVDGVTTWVPRVTRDRKVICGFKPTFDAATRPTNAAPQLDGDVVQIEPAAPPTERPSLFGNARPTPQAAPTTTPKAPAATVATPAPKAAPVVIQPKAQPAPTKSTAKAAPSTVKAAPAKTTAAAAAPSPAPAKTVVSTTVPAQAERRTTGQAPRASGIISPCREGVTQYKGSTVRCGPQAQSPVTPGVGGPIATPPQINLGQSSALPRPPVGTVVRVGEAAPDVRIVPKHVYEARLTNAVSSYVPEGYRRAFEDGRLDTERAVMTFAGHAQTNLIWTETVPRRLIQVKLDSDTSEQTTTRVKTGERVQTNTVSTRSEAPQKSLRLAGTPYVQVAQATDAAQAQALARDVRRLGVPVRIGRYERNGATQRIVLAGPFATQAEAASALAKAKSAGFGSAFLRK